MSRLVERSFDAVNGADGLKGGLLYRVERVENPSLPLVPLPNGLEEPVVVAFRSDNMAAEVEHVHDASGPPVALVERMDALELVRNERHLEKRVRLEGGVAMDESFQFSHQAQHILGILGRHVDDLAGPIPQGGTRKRPEPRPVFLQHLLEPQNVVEGQEPGVRHLLEPHAQRLAVAEDLLGRRIARPLGLEAALEQFVVGGDDVFDLGTVLRFLKPQGIDENALVRNRGRHALFSSASFFRMGAVSKRVGRRCSKGGMGDTERAPD